MAEFKRGSNYTRPQVFDTYRPNERQPTGGPLYTGYATFAKPTGASDKDDLVIFMNIGVPGRTKHDFDNEYDPKTGLITWFGKPNSHSQQPQLKKMIKGELTPQFFARWKQGDSFTYLGTGKVLSVQDGGFTKSGIPACKFVITIREVVDIFNSSELAKTLNLSEVIEESGEASNSFVFEKHLEDFIVHNWARIPLSTDYEIYTDGNNRVGQQFSTGVGPIDILANRRDKKGFLVVELKRDRVSDKVVGQTLRYMGWVRQNLCQPDQDVRGCIIGSEGDEKLQHAISETPTIDFLKYEVNFNLSVDHFFR